MLDTQTIMQYFLLIFIPTYGFLFVVLPLWMNSAHLKRNETRSMPLCVDADTFRRRFDERIAGERRVTHAPYYHFRWKTAGKSFTISRKLAGAAGGDYPYPLVLLSGRIENREIVYTLTASATVSYSAREEVCKVEVVLKELCI